MNIVQLTLPNLIGYTIVLTFLWRSLAHRFEWRDFQRKQRAQEKEVNRALAPLYFWRPHQWYPLTQGPITMVKTSLPTLPPDHPTVAVLRKLAAVPNGLPRDTQLPACWLDEAISQGAGRLLGKSISVSAKAPMYGILFTIIGFCMASAMFGETNSHEAMIASVGMAMITTIIASIATIIERGIQTGLEPIIKDAVAHGLQAAECWMILKQAETQKATSDEMPAEELALSEEVS